MKFHTKTSRDMTLVAITGIEDPLRPDVRDAVTDCHHAGVTVKMCAGDNIPTTRSIPIQCGTYTSVSRPSPISRSWPGLPLGLSVSAPGPVVCRCSHLLGSWFPLGFRAGPKS